MRVASSKGDGSFYNVTTPTVFNDAVCECPGYIHRGKCRHIDELEYCVFVAHGEQVDEDRKLCPDCGSGVQMYDLEPTYDTGRET